MEARTQQSRLPRMKPTLRNKKLCADIKAKINSSLNEDFSNAGSAKSSDSDELKVALYNSILDLRKQQDLKPTPSPAKIQASSVPKSSASNQKMAKTFTAKDKTVSKRCMQITTFACSQNSFDTATSIITERIISKQLELEREKKCTRRLLQRQGRMPQKIDEVIVERILEKEDELKNKKLPSITSSDAADSVNVKSVKFLEQEHSTMQDTYQVSKLPRGKKENQVASKQRMESPKLLKKASINAKDIVNANKKIARAKTSILKDPVRKNDAGEAKSNALKNKCSKLYKSLPDLENFTRKKSVSILSSTKNPKFITLPKFVLSSRPAGRVMVQHMATQDNIKDEQCSTCTQTMTNLDDFSVQTNIVNTTSDLSVQAKLHIGLSTEGTNTIPVASFNRYTSTLKQPDIVKQTQMVEYMTGNDLYCLEWVRDYLFDIDFDHRQIIVGDKLKEVSEVGTKTSVI